ncbi:hypothetical protein [Streptacidiphilus sp. PAMC 29251]
MIVTPFLLFVVVGLPLLGALVVIPLVLVVRHREQRSRQAVDAVAVLRPGWTGVTAPAPGGLHRRYRSGRPFNGPNPGFRTLLYGPLPGGAQAEVFHFSTTYRQNKSAVVTAWTVASVVVPRPLPSVSVRPTGDPAEAATPVPVGDGHAQSYNEATFGPLWAGLRGYSLDPGAAAALFTPEVLGRSRALGLDWRMEGRALLAVAPDHRPPAAMLQLVDTLAWFAALVPEEVLRAAAEQPDPWAGPSAERPA